jgi:hypothetical protein
LKKMPAFILALVIGMTMLVGCEKKADVPQPAPQPAVTPPPAPAPAPAAPAPAPAPAPEPAKPAKK